MKNTLLALLILASTLAYGQTYYAVQVMSTENPHLIKPEMVVTDSTDVPYVDLVVNKDKMMSRILYIFGTKQEQIINHTEWIKMYPDAIVYTIDEKRFKSLRKLFDSIQ